MLNNNAESSALLLQEIKAITTKYILNILKTQHAHADTHTLYKYCGYISVNIIFIQFLHQKHLLLYSCAVISAKPFFPLKKIK